MKMWYHNLYTFLLCFLLIIPANGQKGTGYFFVRFKDKAGTTYTLDHPEAFLSLRALQRRSDQGIQLNERDLPVSEIYVDSLETLGMHIHLRSKWFNAVTVSISDTALLDTLKNLDFVASIEKTRPLSTQKSAHPKWDSEEASVISNEMSLFHQLSLENGDQLHQLGYRGEGIIIAVLDAGFFDANTLPALDSLFTEQRVIGTKDFVMQDGDVFLDHPHGMNVLSVLAGLVPGELTGSAPDASYWLLRTEDAGSEYIFEEDCWVAGAEFADSAGADIITSSLGYFVFDDSTQNHTYTEMNGNTTRVALAAKFAAQRGMIVVTSAGNEGNKPWHYIISPADADSILAVGAVDSLGNRASFSSAGPASDGRIKPDVMAMGVQVLMQGTSGSLIRANGTSFSAPVISGLTACLRQAFPNAGTQEIIRAVKQSSHMFTQPDNLYGYGIPDFLLAFGVLNSLHSISSDDPVHSYPNPFADRLFLSLPSITAPDIRITLYTTTGQVAFYKEINQVVSGQKIISVKGLGSLPDGMYLLTLQDGDKKYITKVIKNAGE